MSDWDDGLSTEASELENDDIWEFMLFLALPPAVDDALDSDISEEETAEICDVRLESELLFVFEEDCSDEIEPLTTPRMEDTDVDELLSAVAEEERLALLEPHEPATFPMNTVSPPVCPLATAMSFTPSLLRSTTIRSDAVPPAAERVSALPNVPFPFPSMIETSPHAQPRATISSLPSLLMSESSRLRGMLVPVL